MHSGGLLLCGYCKVSRRSVWWRCNCWGRRTWGCATTRRARSLRGSARLFAAARKLHTLFMPIASCALRTFAPIWFCTQRLEHRSSSRPTAELADTPHPLAFSHMAAIYPGYGIYAHGDIGLDPRCDGSAVPSIGPAWTTTDCPQGRSPTAAAAPAGCRPAADRAIYLNPSSVSRERAVHRY